MKTAFMRKTVVVLCGCVVILAGLEIALRITGLAFLGREAEERRGPGPLVLCLGDSFTFGMGAAEGESYPAQLEGIGRERGFGFRTVNRGRPAANTSVILETLEENLAELRPDIVLILAGAPNTWNTYGLPAPDTGLTTRLGALFFHLRAFRLLRLLRLNLAARRGSLAAPVPGAGTPGIRDRLNEPGEEEGPVGGDSPEARLLKEDGDAYFYAGRYADAAEIFSRIIDLDPDSDGAYFLVYKSYMAAGDEDAALAFLNKTLDAHPDFMQLRRDAVFLLLPAGRGSEAVEIVLGGLRQKPLDRVALNAVLDFLLLSGGGSGQAFALLDRIADEGLVPEAQLASFRQAAKMGASRWTNKWVYTDMIKIIRLCRDCGARVLVQNYPDNAALSDVLFTAASDSGAQFLNQRRSFLRLPEDDRRLYFAPDGHCNGRGYKRMAENILARLFALGWIKTGEDR